MRCSGFGVAVMAGVVIASNTTSLDGHGGTSGEEECCDSERLHGGLRLDGGFFVGINDEQ